MARTPFDPRTVRPSCPKHPGSTVRLDGYKGCGWSPAYRRPRYRCVIAPKTRGHSFTLPVPVRQPTANHPDSGQACPHCEHIFERHEGVKTGRSFIFGHQEIARLFLRIGEGMSLRDASRELRDAVFRVNQREPTKHRFTRMRPGETSKQAALASNYLDAYAAGVVEALHPRTWPRVVILDSTTLMTRGYRSPGAVEIRDGRDPSDELQAGNLKAGTILIAMDPTGPAVKPCLVQVRGGKDVESWKAFFATLGDAPEWVIADLDPAIARAVRETWPKAILYHSRHHLEELMRQRAIADGVPERVRLDQPIPVARPLPWTGSPVKRWADHPLFEAMRVAQRGPLEWAAFKDAVAQHVEPDKLELRAWMATNELLIERQWRIARRHGRIPLSTGALEGKIGEWLAPLQRRAGRWQNARRLNLVLGLITLRGRGEAREARYANLVRAQFEARANHSHLPAENLLPMETYRGKERQMSWWRTWHDSHGASLPRLVAESDRRTRRRAADDHAALVRERLEAAYARATNLRTQLGIAAPPRGRPKNPMARPPASVKGRFLREFDDLLLEWDWDGNGDLDPMALAAGTNERVAWRCLLNPAHVWETRVVDRTYKGVFCPYHMGNRVHPADSLAAYYPWLAREWHPTKNALRSDEVARASGREVAWRCEQGHEWPAAVYSRTLSNSGCPECAKVVGSTKSRAAKQRKRQAAEARVDARLATLVPLADLAAGDEPF
jgi:hypothetical protein